MSKQLQIFWYFTAAYFLSYFYRSANAVIAPNLSQDLSLSAEQLGLMTSLFFGAFALIQIPLGVGLDKWGPRWVTSGLMIVGVVGSLVFAMAPSFLVLALGRALIGVGMAGILMGSLKIFSQWFSPRRFATISSLLVGIGSSGALIAATPLAWLNNTVGWRSVFLAGAVITAVVALVIAAFSRNTPPGVVWPGGSDTDGSFKTIFADLRFWRIAPLTFFTTGTLLSFQGLWAGPYLFDTMSLDEIATGNILLLMGIGTTIGFAASGWLADRLGLTLVALISAAVFLASQLLLILQPPLAVVRLLYLLFGFSGAFNIVLLALVRRLFPESITGQAVTAVNLFGIGGTFLLQWWLGLIIGAFAVDSAGHYPPQAYITALSFTAVGLLISLVWYFPLTRTGGVVEAELVP
ncbi:MAG: MFS transporter [Anaerolineae bacterium]|nr:MFS transporter [Anaerolineae bacterium]